MMTMTVPGSVGRRRLAGNQWGTFPDRQGCIAGATALDHKADSDSHGREDNQNATTKGNVEVLAVHE